MYKLFLIVLLIYLIIGIYICYASFRIFRHNNPELTEIKNKLRLVILVISIIFFYPLMIIKIIVDNHIDKKYNLK